MPRGRPPYLPAQENVENTYLDPQYRPQGDYLVSQVTHDSSEADVREVWDYILREVFTADEFFSIRHEGPVQGGRTDIQVSRIMNRQRLNFLVLELKRPSFANGAEALSGAEEQLLRYINSLGHTKKNKMWGALCIGKSVQFYSFKKEDRIQLVALHADMLRIDRQPQLVTQWLNYIRTSII
ncbi:hypothetical protein IL306_007589 [Fusarium sp. DS 682]|nr:hypothetical protein IL306_007589 [Fusarium sp. DS 682]